MNDNRLGRMIRLIGGLVSWVFIFCTGIAYGRYGTGLPTVDLPTMIFWAVFGTALWSYNTAYSATR